MTQIPILSGIVASGAEFATAFPVNMIPTTKATGISNGFLRPAEGIVTVADGGGANRGGYRWRDEHYRVMGANFVKVAQDGTITILGQIGGFDWCSFAESFDYLAINGGGKLYLYNGTTLTQVTDIDLGTSLDVEWINGYFMSTDGASLVVTDINDPFSVNPLRYGSSELNPDPVTGLQKLRNEIYALNRYTIEVFAAVTNPGTAFPFARVDGAQIMKGAVGSRAACEFQQALAFLGSGQNDPPAVWLGQSGQAVKLSTRDIDAALRTYSDTVLAKAVLESRLDKDQELLYVHLPDKTFVYDGVGSLALQTPVWFVLQSGTTPRGYTARGLVWCYNRWNVADPFGTKIGYLSESIGSHYGNPCRWEFTTPIVYNEGRGVQVHELELVAVAGDVALADDVMIATQYSLDGKQWSQAKYIRAGRRGERNRRLVWDRQGEFRHWRAQRFVGDSRAHLSFARLEARLEMLK